MKNRFGGFAQTESKVVLTGLDNSSDNLFQKSMLNNITLWYLSLPSQVENIG